MPRTVVSSAHANWKGDLQSGSGTTTLATSNQGSFDVTWKARSEEHGGLTSPEELIAAAHAACFSMQFSSLLTKAGATVENLDTSADVSFVDGPGITGIRLAVNGRVSGISEEEYLRIAEEAKKTCPVSQAITGTEVTLDATFASSAG